MTFYLNYCPLKTFLKNDLDPLHEILNATIFIYNAFSPKSRRESRIVFPKGNKYSPYISLNVMYVRQ